MTNVKPHEYRSGWTCPKGHRSNTYLMMNREGGSAGEMSLMAGSSWDCCDECSEPPSAPEVVRMRLDIFRQWADAGIITPEEHGKLAERLGDKVSVRPWAERMADAMAGGADPGETTGGAVQCVYPGCPEDAAENWYRRNPAPPPGIIPVPLCLQHDGMVPQEDGEAERWLAALDGAG